MTVQQRQEKLIKQISALKDDEVLTMLEQELSFFTRNKGKDIVDGLNVYQLKELIDMVNEPSEQDVVNEDSYRYATSKWRSK